MDKLEVWKPIKDYEGIYEISNLGRLKSLSRTIRMNNGKQRNLKTKILKPISLGNYQGFQLTNDSGSKKFYTHRLVCAAFIGEPEGDCITVNHKDGDKYNNVLSNLEWTSYSDNLKHSYETGLNKNTGERSHYSKFSEEVVEEVRRMYSTGNFKQSELSDIYGISRMQIHRIVKFKSRKNIKRVEQK